MCLGRGEGFGKVTPGQGGGWLEGVGGFKGTSGRGQEKFVFSPKNRPQGENECSAAAEEAEEIREGCPGGAGWVEGGAR